MPEPVNQDAPPCSICSQLKDYERGFQVGGREEEDTFLPAAASRLKKVRDLKPEGCRYMYLEQCPECEAYYLYKSDYEYLAFGSEDEQILERLTAAEVAKYLAWPEGEKYW